MFSKSFILNYSILHTFASFIVPLLINSAQLSAKTSTLIPFFVPVVLFTANWSASAFLIVKVLVFFTLLHLWALASTMFLRPHLWRTAFAWVHTLALSQMVVKVFIVRTKLFTNLVSRASYLICQACWTSSMPVCSFNSKKVWLTNFQIYVAGLKFSTIAVSPIAALQDQNSIYIGFIFVICSGIKSYIF